MSSRSFIFLYFNLLLFFTHSALAQKSDPSVVVKKAPFPVTIVIDPGHGGKDPGKPRGSASKKHEKDLNLDIAYRLGGYLSERVKNVKILYTRMTDKYVSLDERVKIANENNADLFISIHCNSSNNRSNYGTQTHIQSHGFNESRKLADLVEKQFRDRAGRKSWGVKDKADRRHNLQVLQYTNMPAILVEAGFMSNRKEEAFLNSGEGQSLIASAIFRGVRTYILEHYKPSKKGQQKFPYYKVQIMSSIKYVDPNSSKFKSVNRRIDVFKTDTSNKYKYQYMVGREYSKADANRLVQEMKRKGYKDAFIVTFSKTTPVYRSSK
ncbi:N-acetylmuramoyl-L-alanine amidase family protein [Sediminitomix flava]|uniref:N-acetylmuramoyl-L-alanine amidase n=1 Tax=Sediminitomix flava TaxID=379075 RepID=A0A315Z2B7_SEDFL|nr:N-acetylmuramoyl-L-alanine amidase [Sediminitomix flava]PWJ36140.1 N-acetylmuramoyl-L-alanine amidase [Sediminitomix flava]